MSSQLNPRILFLVFLNERRPKEHLSQQAPRLLLHNTEVDAIGHHSPCTTLTRSFTEANFLKLRFFFAGDARSSRSSSVSNVLDGPEMDAESVAAAEAEAAATTTETSLLLFVVVEDDGTSRGAIGSGGLGIGNVSQEPGGGESLSDSIAVDV